MTKLTRRRAIGATLAGAAGGIAGEVLAGKVMGGAARAAQAAPPSSASPSSTPPLSMPAAAATPAGPQTLWYTRPAGEWVEALPVGNGRLGAMVFGGITAERLQLNEDTFHAGGPYDAINPQVASALPEVRRLIFAGRYAEAARLADTGLISRPRQQMPYQPLADLLAVFPGLEAVRDYRRTLDLDGAVAQTVFTSSQGTQRRTVFASHPDQVLVMRVESDMQGQVAGEFTLGTPQDASVSVEGDDTLVLRGRNPARHGVDGRLRFTVRLKIRAEGKADALTLRVSPTGLHVKGADAVVLVLAAATSYRRFDDLDGDPDALTAARLAAVAAKPYAALLADHQADHRRLFRRVALRLDGPSLDEEPTDARVQAQKDRADPGLATLYFDYARYLMIACSRPGGQPANLQGLWNERLDPAWESKWTININTQMNYWPAEALDLGECVAPLIEMVRDLAQAGAHTARGMYGAGGWVAHSNTDLWRNTTPPDGARWALWPTGGAWLCRHLWDRYEYGGRDRAVLADIYPLLKGASQFFLDTLQPHPTARGPHGPLLVTNPSLSPENEHPFGAAVCAGPAMDAQILRDLFQHTALAGERLGLDADFVARVRAARERLPPDAIGAAGQLQEWLDDWDMRAPEIHHRHVSHLYALYPSDQIEVTATPALAAAARRSLEIRGDEATGWGLAWRLALWARLGDGEHAHAILRRLLQPDRTYPNLFDAHPPFQIDGNFGATAAMAEMIVSSRGDTLVLLPALPAAWATGQARGLRARGGIGVDLAWESGRLRTATLRPDHAGTVRVRLGDGPALDLRLEPGRTLTLAPEDGGRGLRLV